MLVTSILGSRKSRISKVEWSSQALGRALGVLLKKGRRNSMSQVGGVVIMMKELTETANLSAWKFIDSGPAISKPA